MRKAYSSMITSEYVSQKDLCELRFSMITMIHQLPVIKESNEHTPHYTINFTGLE
jgi:hypothetical protein